MALFKNMLILYWIHTTFANIITCSNTDVCYPHLIGHSKNQSRARAKAEVVKTTYCLTKNTFHKQLRKLCSCIEHNGIIKHKYIPSKG